MLFDNKGLRQNSQAPIPRSRRCRQFEPNEDTAENYLFISASKTMPSNELYPNVNRFLTETLTRY
jgi:hypothetical protein